MLANGKLVKKKSMLRRVTVVMLLGIFFMELVRTAWISDDAGITLRTVINFLNGYGPRFNVAERVQGYTHPLWFLLLSAVSYIAGNVYYATFFVSIIVSLVTFWMLIIKIPTKFSGGVIAGLILILSKSYIDFSTSGLENPLSHLLLVTTVFLAIGLSVSYQAKALALFCVICGLLYLTRVDLMVLIAPLVVYIIARSLSVSSVHLQEGVLRPWWRPNKPASSVFKALLLGSLPVLLWTIFSIYYYGFPFPNTAYAKLATGIPLADRVSQGCSYFLHFAQTDSLSCLTILVGVALGFERRNYLAASISIGIVFYLGYVLSIGGDFMMGRFFTAPLLMATMQIARLMLSPIKVTVAIILVVSLGVFNINKTLLSGSDYFNQDATDTGIADERGFWHWERGLITERRPSTSQGIFSMRNWSIDTQDVRVECGGVGFMSLSTGPGTHFIDTCALTDPLLARLPSLPWKQRIGHFNRALPVGYIESVANDKNLVEDDETRKLYQSIRLITRGDLNDTNRLRAIVSMNLSVFQKTLDRLRAKVAKHYPR
jgi:arabinofuranosyltransferase